MAVLPSANDLSRPASARTGRIIASGPEDSVGPALQRLGGVVSAIGEEQKRQQDALGMAKAEAELNQGLINVGKQFDNDPDYGTFSQRAPKATGDVVNRAAKHISDPNLRERWVQGANTDAVRLNASIDGKADTLGKQATIANLDQALETQRRIYVDPETTEEQKQKARADIQATLEVASKTGILTPDEADRRAQLNLRDANYSRAKLVAETQPDVIIRPLPQDVNGRSGAAIAFFQSQGWTKEQAAGIVGNLIAESRLNTEARNRGDGTDGSDSIGIGQWNGNRAKALRDFAASRGKDWHDFETQLAFVNHELQTSESTAGQALKAAKNVDEATAAFIGYERPAGWSAANPRGGHNFKGRLTFASQAAGVDPNPDWFRDMSPEQREAVYETAERVSLQRQAQADASQRALQDSVRDSYALRIATDDPTLTTQDILADTRIDNGVKASLVNSYNTAMKTAIESARAVAAYSSGTLRVDPYSTDGRKQVDAVGNAIETMVPEEQRQSALEGLVRQSGTVPQPVINRIRAGAESQNADDVLAALQSASRFSQVNPSALGRREGGEAVQRKVDDFDYYVNTLNLDPQEAARRIAEQNDPNKVRDRKALEPAAKEFRKSLEGTNLGTLFDESWLPFNTPNVGFTEGQAAGIAADYMAIAEEQFFSTGGNAELAKTRAEKEMKRLYGVSDLSGAKTVMKYPPEKFWPVMPGESDPYGYVKDQLINDLASTFPDDASLNPRKSGTGFVGNVAGRTVDIRDESGLPEFRKLARDDIMKRVILVATPQTGAEIKANQLPGYTVLFKDDAGNIQTLYGKQWRPDVSAVVKQTEQQQQSRLERAYDYQTTGQTMADYLRGGDIPMGAGSAWDNPEQQQIIPREGN